MPTLPWRLLIATDLGIDPQRLVGLDPRQPDRWLADLELELTVKAPQGPQALPFRDGAAFEPPALQSALGGAEGGALDAVLHDPVFQRAESAWRGIRFLANALTEDLPPDAGTGPSGPPAEPPSITIEILAAPRAQLAARLRELVFEPCVVEGAAPAPALILLDVDVSHQGPDLTLLKELAEMAGVLQAPIVAAGSPAFFGMRYMAHVAALKDMVDRSQDASHSGWIAFQASDRARWIALTMNRYLQRAPYEMEDPAYRETVSESQPETFLWGRGIWLVGAAALRSLRRYGHGLDLSGQGGRFAGLPARPYPHKPGEMVALAAEAPLPEMKAMELSRIGFTPVVGIVRSDNVLLPYTVTVFRLRPGMLTLEGTLAYQLMAGRLAQFMTVLLGELPPEPAQSVAMMQRELVAFLGPLAGEEPEQAVSVEAVAAEIEGQARTLANVKITPPISLEGKPVAFEFAVPLG